MNWFKTHLSISKVYFNRWNHKRRGSCQNSWSCMLWAGVGSRIMCVASNAVCKSCTPTWATGLQHLTKRSCTDHWSHGYKHWIYFLVSSHKKIVSENLRDVFLFWTCYLHMENRTCCTVTNSPHDPVQKAENWMDIQKRPHDPVPIEMMILPSSQTYLQSELLTNNRPPGFLF